MALLSAMWCDAVSEVEPSGDEPSGAELTRYGPARWHSAAIQPPRPPRGGHPSSGGELNHPDRLAAATPPAEGNCTSSSVSDQGHRTLFCVKQINTAKAARVSVILNPPETTLPKRNP